MQVPGVGIIVYMFCALVINEYYLLLIFPGKVFYIFLNFEVFASEFYQGNIEEHANFISFFFTNQITSLRFKYISSLISYFFPVNIVIYGHRT